MPICSESLLPLVSSNLMLLSFTSARHCLDSLSNRTSDWFFVITVGYYCNAAGLRQERRKTWSEQQPALDHLVGDRFLRGQVGMALQALLQAEVLDRRLPYAVI